MKKIIEKVVSGIPWLAALNSQFGESVLTGLWIQEEKPSVGILETIPYEEEATEVVLVYSGDELAKVPHGTRVLQFIETRGEEFPVAAVRIEPGTVVLSAPRRLVGAKIYFIGFDEAFHGSIREKIEAEKKMFFQFIPAEYRRDRGVTVEENGTVVLCSDLRDAMRTGKYSWCGTEWAWDRDARPVAFTEGRMYSHNSLGGWHYAIIWFYDQNTQKWNGWECYPRHSGTPVLWSVLNDPDKPDFVSDEPKDSAEFYKDPAFQGVSLDKFIGFISSVFMTEWEKKTPQEFAAEMATRPYQAWAGCASFYAIPTPQNEWGWGYDTVSGRQLVWLPGCTVFTRRLRESQNFRSTVETVLGEIVELAEPDWLESSLKQAIAVDRPCISEDCDEPSEAHNEGFFAAIRQKPFEV